ncbi:MAG: hypothetical protein DVB27_09175 [Verrucomicrobia bacterium]|nr:MAG: hypothetical protein DVB27_09175 [Verrucomicrobiota bacterium]
MLIERFVRKEKRNVVLFAPKAARQDVWEPVLRQLLPDLNSGFVNLLRFKAARSCNPTSSSIR